MISSKEVKKCAKKCGADLVGIASMDRFEGAPREMDPRYIFPEAKALIVLGFRIPRGLFRGIEEGTYFGAYPSMGYGGINVIYAPIVLRELVCFIEDRGYEAVPYPNIYPGYDTNPIDPGTGELRKTAVRAVSPDKPAPDIFIHFRIAAFCAGLGEIGYSKMLLTPEFGPRQRVVLCLTDAPLKPDPIYSGPPICDRCMLCVKDCSGKAISSTETVKVKVAGRELEWGKLDVKRCSIAYTGGVKETSPFYIEGYDIEEEIKKPLDEINRTRKYNYGAVYDHNPAIEGARGCIRACMIHLEKEKRIKNLFKNPFRKRKPWILK